MGARPATRTGLRIGVRLLLAGALAGAPMVQALHGTVVFDPPFSSVPVPRDVVAALAQERNGLLWVGTGDGLARWDGYRLRPVERESASISRRNLGWVRALAPDAEGRMWIGSEAEGLILHENETLQTLGSASPQHATVVALAVAGGSVWMGTMGDGLQRYDIAGRRFERVPLPERRVLALGADDQGELWIGHWQGLARLPRGAQQPLPVDGVAGVVQALLVDKTGQLWIGRQDGWLGRLRRGEAVPQWLPASAERGGSSAISSLAQDAQGRIWVGRAQGIDLVDATSMRLLMPLRSSPQMPGGLGGGSVTSLLRDAAGSMWVGGYGLGLQRHDGEQALQVRGPDPLPEPSAADAPLRDIDVRALLLRRDGSLLAATQAGSLARLDAELRSRGLLPREVGGAPVEAMAEEPGGRLWLAAGGQLEWREADGRLRQRWPLPGGRANRLRLLANGELWVAAQEGLHVLQREADGRYAAALRRARQADGQELVGETFAVLPDPRDGRHWVASTRGLWRGRAGSLQLEPVVEAPGQGLGFPAVLGLLLDAEGRLWLDTAVSGLHRLTGFDADGRARFDRVSERLGLAGRPFGANLQLDGQGRIWSQSHVYDPAADRLDRLDEADGLRIGTPWFFSEAALPDGRLVFGGSRGLLVVQPSAFKPSPSTPPLVLTALSVAGRPQPLPPSEETVRLPPRTRGFSVEFAALDYTAPARLRYRYQLQGYDADWLDSDASRRAASYGELPPGRYVLRVQGSNRHGVWSPRELQLRIEVAAAWWQLPWAQGLGGVAALLLVWGFVQWRTRQLRLREARLQVLVEERTQALREAALTDPLTGLKNRRYLMQRIQADLHLSQRRREKQASDNDLVVFLIDIDHFKKLNDTRGHAAGDAALQQVAERLRGVFRDSDVLVRWGGEEFLAVATGSRREHAGELAERVREAIGGAPMVMGDQGLQMARVTASVGFAVFPLDESAPEAWDWPAVLQLADAALYAAKAAGRDTWVGVRAAPGLSPKLLRRGSELLETPGLEIERRS